MQYMSVKSRQFLLLFVGVLLMVIGLFRDEASEIMQKAIYVCLECVGLE